MVACSSCGATADAPPLTWTSERTRRGPSWRCDRCTAEQLRAIEGRLDLDEWEVSGGGAG